jgi:RimJ/RimL family protein N-acetyltransferase
MEGRICRVVPLDPAIHTDDLWQSFTANTDGRNWTYLSVDAPATSQAFRSYLDAQKQTDDPLGHAIIERASGKAVGMASYMRVKPAIGTIEVGNVNYSEIMKRTAVGTEAMYLMMVRVFDELGYRRYEWKCDDFNSPSKSAALRLGFKHEGLFRQAVVYKGRNRDTAWFSIIDTEWPDLKRAYQAWLAPTNFDDSGRQKRKLADLMNGRGRDDEPS